MEFEALISPEEKARAQRFHSALDLRSLLGGYVGCGPRQVDISSSAYGKPCLAGKDGEGSLQFSLSHSGAYAAFAFGRYRCVGVDIEEVREMAGIVAQHVIGRLPGNYWWNGLFQKCVTKGYYPSRATFEGKRIISYHLFLERM
jgi:hypothetical protein